MQLPEDIDLVLEAIESKFRVTPWLMLVPAFLIFIIVKKVPPLPALLAGSLMGGIFAIIFQPHLVREVALGLDPTTTSFFKSSYLSVMQSIFGDISITTSNDMVNELLSSSGMRGMLNTIWLILSAMVFGGAMESAGLLVKITSSVIRWANPPDRWLPPPSPPVSSSISPHRTSTLPLWYPVACLQRPIKRGG